MKNLAVKATPFSIRLRSSGSLLLSAFASRCLPEQREDAGANPPRAGANHRYGRHYTRSR